MLVQASQADTPVIQDDDSAAVITLPETWRLQEMSGVKNKVGVGNTYGDFTVNIYVTSEQFPGTWTEYQKSNRELIEMMYKDFKVLTQDLINSKHGVPLVRLVARSHLKRDLQQFFYYGPGQGQTFFTVICTVPLEQGSHYTSVFDELAQQIRVQGTHDDDAQQEGVDSERQVITTIEELTGEEVTKDAER